MGNIFRKKPQNQKLVNGNIERKINPESASLPPKSFDDEALALMRAQLNEDSEAFLLNNILMSVQFFENYERDLEDIKRNPISERERTINEAMIQYNKHVVVADRIQEYVNEYVGYQKTSHSQVESLTAPRLYVIYNNVEATHGRGDTSDNVLNVPFYKLGIEDSNEPGYINLKKLEVLEKKLSKETDSNDHIQSDVEKDSIDSENTIQKEENLYEEITKPGIIPVSQLTVRNINNKEIEHTGRRVSGPNRIFSTQVNKGNISKIRELKRINIMLPEEEANEKINNNMENNFVKEENFILPRKSILKVTKPNNSEIAGYQYKTNNPQDEANESDSDYGYTTITQAATPRNVVTMSTSYNSLLCYGVLPDKTWILVEVDSSDEDQEYNDYLNSIQFMNNFLDSFISKLGSALGLSQRSIQSSKTQGASIYYSVTQTNKIIGHEVYPALNAIWPKAAKQWHKRKRKVIKNPRTNYQYQWPTDDMIKKAKEIGCSLIPIGYRPKRGNNENQKMQWKIVFPAAERYLESCLAHAHIRCYLFTLTLYKTFIENETSKIGIDASHIKNHLFWQCEDNYAKWPEHRLGESLLEFLRRFKMHCSQRCFPNYFMAKCDDFECIPNPLLTKQHNILHLILETPVMHVLFALAKLKYNKEEFYPNFNVHRLYNILTTKNVLDLVNPNLPKTNNELDTKQKVKGNPISKINNNTSAKLDQGYLRRKKKYEKIQNNQKRKGQLATITEATATKEEIIINTNIVLPKKMHPIRRQLVLEFFISHFISMAETSKKFNAISQAIIYLEQAQRLCILLKDDEKFQAKGDEFLTTIKDELVVCQKKLVNQVGYNRPLGRTSSTDRIAPEVPPRLDHYSSVDSSTDANALTITFAQVHSEKLSNNGIIKFIDFGEGDEDSKL